MVGNESRAVSCGMLTMLTFGNMFYAHLRLNFVIKTLYTLYIYMCRLVLVWFLRAECLMTKTLRLDFVLKTPTLGVGEFEWGFTPSRHLRPPSGREHKIVELIQSDDDDYSMNKTRRKPTTGRQSPSLFDKWHGVF